MAVFVKRIREVLVPDRPMKGDGYTDRTVIVPKRKVIEAYMLGKMRGDIGEAIVRECDACTYATGVLVQYREYSDGTKEYKRIGVVYGS